MEKFRVYTDEKTGINAFVPIWINNRPDSIKKALNYTVGVALLIVRSILLSISYVFFTISSICESSMGKRNTISSILNYMFSYFGIFALGYPMIFTSAADFKRVGMRPLKNTGRSICSLRKNLIVSNITSVVDVLMFGIYLNPMFLVPHVDGSLSALTLPAAVRYFLGFSLLAGQGEFRNLTAAVAAHKNTPLVWLPEGQKSNGSCMLQWRLPASSEEDESVIRSSGIVAIAHPQGKHVITSAPHTCGSPLNFFLRMALYGGFHSAEVTFVGAEDMQAHLTSEKSIDEVVKKVGNTILKAIGRGATWVNTGSEQLAEFADVWG